AFSVIKWMNNHSRALGLFHREQLQTYNKTLALILPVITRWTAHYLSLRRLLDIEISIRACWMKYSKEMIECAGPRADVQQKAREIQAVVEDPQFWAQVKRTCSHLHPLAIAANITQASTTRLDHVLTTLGNLYRIYSDAQLEDAVQTKVLASLEKRWAAADQDPFIAAVILNPFLRGTCFSREDVTLTPIGLCNMLKRLHLRIFRCEVDYHFQSAFMDYYNCRAEFSNAFMCLAAWEEEAQLLGREVNPVKVWEGIDSRKQVGRNRLVQLAMHVLSVVANSAGCERAFSHMGLVQTATRSRLSVDKVRKTTIVGMDLKRSHIEFGLLRTRERRDFS
ncbi:ribonuclease H-like domain-containing protein, partial [Lactarius hengduanensis]